MSLIFIDGFDHYNSSAIGEKWNSWNGSIYSTSGRRGGGCIGLTNRFYNGYKNLGTSDTTWIFGAAFRYGSLGRDLFAFCEGSTNHCYISTNSSGYLEVRNGSGTLLGTSTGATINTNNWTFIEMKVYVHSSAGTVDVRINGVSVLSLTGKNTRNGGSGILSTLYIGQTSTAVCFDGYIDDLYLCNSSGSTNTTFLGDVRIDTLLPTGDGNYTQFTPSTGTAHYSNVNKTTPSTTPYNSSATSGQRDSYTFPTLASLTSQTIYGIQINAAALKSDAGARSLGTMSRLSSTDKDGAGAAMSTTQTYISEIQETDPASAAWTESSINSAQFGVKVTA